MLAFSPEIRIQIIIIILFRVSLEYIHMTVLATLHIIIRKLNTIRNARS